MFAVASAVDAAGNVGTLRISVVMQQAGAPRLSLNGGNLVQVEAGTMWTDPWGRIEGGVDGDLSPLLQSNMTTPFLAQPGTVIIKYFMASGNSQGLLCVPRHRTLVIRDTIAPVSHFRCLP